MSTVATKLQFGSRKVQVSTATIALAAATALTPVVAHAGPAFAPFVEGVGDSVGLVVDPVIIPNAAKTAASATASVVADCASAPFSLGCYVVEGAIAGTQAIVRGAVIFIGTTAYVVVEGTGEVFRFVGNLLPGAFGDFFTDIGDGVSAVATGIAQAFHVGSYLTGQ